MTDIRYCDHCKQYTMKDTCRCGRTTISRSPAKYSPHFKYKHLRREAKKKQLE
ncbi:ribosome biogenesis protein [Candidatus Woesearchaeota archaeon]|nr:ribosome biogenesis protein [Candidatus Woesearchaeota archaeon]